MRESRGNRCLYSSIDPLRIYFLAPYSRPYRAYRAPTHTTNHGNPQCIQYIQCCALTLLIDTLSSSPSRPFPSRSASLSIDWVQDTATATTKWADIGDWDVSGVADFSFAFFTYRNKAGGSWVVNGNPKAAKFNSDISKWITTSVTSLRYTFSCSTATSAFNSDVSKWDTSSVVDMFSTFYKAAAFNSDISKWITSSVTSMSGTFNGAASFTGTGMDLWNSNKVKDMTDTFTSATSISSCSKHRIADAWKSNSAFATWNTAWTADDCTDSTPTDKVVALINTTRGIITTATDINLNSTNEADAVKKRTSLVLELRSIVDAAIAATAGGGNIVAGTALGVNFLTNIVAASDAVADDGTQISVTTASTTTTVLTLAVVRQIIWI